MHNISKHKDEPIAIEALYKRFYAMMYVYALRRTGCKYLAKDVVQQLFLKLIEKGIVLEGIENKKAYLLVLVRNEIIDYVRRENLQRQMMTETMWRSQDITTHDALLEKEYRKTLKVAIEKLPVQRRKVFQLSFELGMKNDEIANVMSISMCTVKCQLQMARKEVREWMRRAA